MLKKNNQPEKSFSRFDKRCEVLRISSDKYDKTWNKYWVRICPHKQNENYFKLKNDLLIINELNLKNKKGP